MSKKEKVTFFCKHCGHETHRWEGKCPGCGEWDALVEAPVAKAAPAMRGGASGGARAISNPLSSPPRPLREHAQEHIPRVHVPIGEFNRVLGGGIVPGGSVLVGGEPGIGKSTLLLQLLGALAGAEIPLTPNPSPPRGEGNRSASLLYITGEEAPSQIAARGLRLDVGSVSGAPIFFAGKGAPETRPTSRPTFDSPNLKLASETELSAILEMLESERPAVAVIDSVQTLRDAGIPSAPGSVSQVRECAMALVEAGRRLNCAIFLIGHVTKEGAIAGPRVLEHIVDTVLTFEGERRLDLRCLRVTKNRFGSTSEAGFFEMTSAGLREVPDPSELLLDREGHDDKGAGAAIGAVCEGTRVLLVELQALTVPVPGGGSPRRRASGVDGNRLAQLLAVLETKAGVPFGPLDVFASAAGGFTIDEPAADLPLALALASVATNRRVREGLVAAGEIGLGGEIRPVPRLDARLSEARRLGFKTLLLPARGRADFSTHTGVKILRAKTVREALAMGLE
ncbi:MAG TPA: DNA repair protein RadA [Planctomycetota bacterium]|nr:DNA repair protein RadA [Planctomycetota bacterium]